MLDRALAIVTCGRLETFNLILRLIFRFPDSYKTHILTEENTDALQPSAPAGEILHGISKAGQKMI